MSEVRSGSGRVVVLGLDGVLTFRNTFWPFLLGLLWRKPQLVSRIPAVIHELWRAVTDRSGLQGLRERCLAVWLAGIAVQDLDEWVDVFARHTVDRRSRPEMLEKVQTHRNAGDRIILLSRSPDLYVDRMAEYLRIEEVVCTELEQTRGLLTGKLEGVACVGEEKRRQLVTRLEEKDYGELTAYGNGETDVRFIELADRGLILDGPHWVEVEKRRSGAGSRLGLVLCSIGAAVFLVSYFAGAELFRLRVFTQFNVLFDADPQRLGLMSHGWGGASYIHPGVALLSLPIRVLVAALGLFMPIDGWALREQIGLLVVPTAAALAAIANGLMFWWLGFGLRQVALLTILSRLSFSSLVFGGVTDLVGLSAFPLAALLALSVRIVVHRGGHYLLWWFVFGTLASWVTITHLGIAGVLFLFSSICAKERFWPLIKNGIVLTVSILVLSVATYHVTDILYEYAPSSESGFVGEYRKKPEIRHFTHGFPAALVNTILPLPPAVVENPLGVAGDAPFKIMFTFEDNQESRRIWNPRGVLVMVLLGLGCVGAWLRRSNLGLAISAGLFVILFNAVLHWTFGEELFFYSQHWQSALALIVAGGVGIARSGSALRSSALITGILAALVMVVGYLNFQILSGMMRIIFEHAPSTPPLA